MKTHASDIKIMAGYRVIGMICREIIVSAMRIALAGELKSIKMLVDADNCIPEDMELMSILNEPDLKLAYTIATDIQEEIMPRYAILHLLDDDEVLMNMDAERLAGRMLNRFIFWRKHPRRRDRYVNFYKVLSSAQRVLYEWCKLMLDEKAELPPAGYRCNYSAGRLKALLAGQAEYHVEVVAELIGKLKDYETRSSYFNIQKK